MCAIDHEINIREVRLSAGAEFIVAIAGDIMTMPGLPKKPAAYEVRIGDDGKIQGLSSKHQDRFHKLIRNNFK